MTTNYDISFHYPPELFQLLVDAIPRLCRSKKDVLLFFRGAGVQPEIQKDLELRVRTDKDSVKKFEMVRTVLTRLNEKGELTLRERREILKRVVEFEDFSRCWPKDELEAKGLVSEIARVINVKDSFTRMRIEKDKLQQKHSSEYLERIKVQQDKDSALEGIRKGLVDLFHMDNAQKRGKVLEGILNQYFAIEGILVREDFCRTGESGAGVVEQIDGVIELDGKLYLVEMKWLSVKVGKEDISPHLVRVYSRGDVGGIFISASEYTKGAIDACKDALAQKTIALCQLQEITLLLERKGSLKSFLLKKIQAAVLDKEPFRFIT